MTSKTVCVFTLPAPSSPSVGPNSSFYFYENTKSQNLVRMRVDTLNYTQCDSEPPRARPAARSDRCCLRGAALSLTESNRVRGSSPGGAHRPPAQV